MVESKDLLYYKATDKYLGTLLASYYQTLTFTLSYQSANSTSPPLERRVVLRGDNLEYELL